MDTSYTPQAADASQHAPIIQSASASTECQTNDSKFAYVLTASILGVIALLVIAIVLLIFAIGIKLICLALGAVGLANMWLAIFADVGVMIIAVLNAIRALFVKKL